jgi:hypothetical protein
VIGTPDDDPAWDDHIKWCMGCEVCESPVRLYDAEGRELRFHVKCFGAIRVPPPTAH